LGTSRYGTVNLLRGVPPGETTITSLAGAGTYLIEFGLLSRLTDDIRYEAAARGAMRAVWARRSSLNLVGNHIDIRTGKWTLQDSGIGPNQDSFYEYLLKAYVLFGDPEYLAMFETFYHAIAKHMKHNHWYVRTDDSPHSLTFFLRAALVAVGAHTRAQTKNAPINVHRTALYLTNTSVFNATV
jgi:mannosidase alpha-like ER degradation enhancer 2